ncbi:L,D-transpeptidase ErfK/SrfK [Pseudomonas duriflava]|uniref:L,D-transpeptidase ErfK/SrfK n=1 Tax=Pseudomonas duriflava TaxID=459528 RepID=A0A562Q9R1_9PSED|nr:L,D-transpeptidase family protein [Pseudomonas duriflava]TWI53459.1 L,D-transpeptidase ErfK/SrfK [Pseudomonas duriflava]
MLSRASSVACLSLATLLAAGSASALELPLPPPGEDIVGQVQVIKAAYEDTFADLGERYDIGYLEMVAANPGVDAWLPGAGTEVVLPTRFILPPGPREGVVINLAEYRMYYYPKDGSSVFTYPLGIGREGWGSPITNTRITGKIKDPSWYPPASIRAEHAAEGDPLPKVVPPGPDNPLGPYKMTLALPGYLIHGSNKKFGIGMRVSHGCFRMLNNNLTELVGMIPVGTPVRIINEPYKFGISDGKLYLEAHEPLSTDDGQPAMLDRHTAVVNAMIRREDLNGQVDLNWDLVRDIVTAQDGLPVEVAKPNASEQTATLQSSGKVM